MHEPTVEQVLAQIRYSVSYQAARHPTTFPEVGAAAVLLVQSQAFADFVASAMEAHTHAPDGVPAKQWTPTLPPRGIPGVQAQPYAPPHDGPAAPSGAVDLDLLAALKASVAATERKT